MNIVSITTKSTKRPRRQVFRIHTFNWDNFNKKRSNNKIPWYLALWCKGQGIQWCCPHFVDQTKENTSSALVFVQTNVYLFLQLHLVSLSVLCCALHFSYLELCIPCHCVVIICQITLCYSSKFSVKNWTDWLINYIPWIYTSLIRGYK